MSKMVVAFRVSIKYHKSKKKESRTIWSPAPFPTANTHGRLMCSAPIVPSNTDMIRPPRDKPIRLKTEKWQEVKDLADELSGQLNMNVSLPDTISYLIKFYREHPMAGTPGGEVLGNAEDRTGTVKGNN
jgi:hypothetical protein